MSEKSWKSYVCQSILDDVITTNTQLEMRRMGNATHHCVNKVRAPLVKHPHTVVIVKAEGFRRWGQDERMLQETRKVFGYTVTGQIRK